tara:strand:+ start:3003 stop:3563 length:561 start_codon:yes stop_codon:yes gene_type:complete
MANTLNQELTGKYVVLRKKIYEDIFPQEEDRVFFVTGGFGANKNAMGNALYGVLVSTGSEFRAEGYHVLKLATAPRINAAQEAGEAYCPKCPVCGERMFRGIHIFKPDGSKTYKVYGGRWTCKLYGKPEKHPELVNCPQCGTKFTSRSVDMFTGDETKHCKKEGCDGSIELGLTDEEAKKCATNEA